MKYIVISVDDSRADYRNKIKSKTELPEQEFLATDARLSTFDISYALRTRGLKIADWEDIKIGEIGCWLSHFDGWRLVVEKDEPMVIFEDDVILAESFSHNLSDFLEEVPEDYDFVSLSVPPDQFPDYLWIVRYSVKGEPDIIGKVFDGKDSQFNYGAVRMAKAYQTWGLGAVLYSPRGARKLISLAREHGLYTPVDCFLFNQAHLGAVTGYAPKPFFVNQLTTFNINAPTTVQDTEII